MTNRRDTQLSKTLSWLLRHAAVKEGLVISSDGFVRISDLLNHQCLEGQFTANDIRRVVEANNKQRFSLRFKDNNLEIGANQGHSLNNVQNVSLKPILINEGIDIIHGTYYKNWDSIRTQGLSRMNRNHIHFAKGLPGDKKVVSGIRNDAEIFIYINLKLAVRDNLTFYQSVNDVILSPGNEKGIIEPKYFLKVYDIYGRELH